MLRLHYNKLFKDLANDLYEDLDINGTPLDKVYTEGDDLVKVYDTDTGELLFKVPILVPCNYLNALLHMTLFRQYVMKSDTL